MHDCVYNYYVCIIQIRDIIIILVECMIPALVDLVVVDVLFYFYTKDCVPHLFCMNILFLYVFLKLIFLLHIIYN